jgi:hypothetical protein
VVCAPTCPPAPGDRIPTQHHQIDGTSSITLLSTHRAPSHSQTENKSQPCCICMAVAAATRCVGGAAVGRRRSRSVPGAQNKHPTIFDKANPAQTVVINKLYWHASQDYLAACQLPGLKLNDSARTHTSHASGLFGRLPLLAKPCKEGRSSCPIDHAMLGLGGVECWIRGLDAHTGECDGLLNWCAFPGGAGPFFLEVGLRHPLFIGKHHRVCDPRRRCRTISPRRIDEE